MVESEMKAVLDEGEFDDIDPTKRKYTTTVRPVSERNLKNTATRSRLKFNLNFALTDALIT